MSRSSAAIEILPFAAIESLKSLGAHLRIARERRGDSLQSMAARIGTSIPTLRRMEAGDAKVAIGVYAAALWVFGKSAELENLIAPRDDEYALILDVDRASKKKATK